MSDVCKLVDFKTETRLVFDCPGCECSHGVPVDGSRGWKWNGDKVKPTVSPSILVTWDWGNSREQKRCHSYVRDGNIQFLGDCTHKLAGKTVPLQPV